MAILGEDDAAAIELNPSTPVGMVRLLITDLDEANPLFLDSAIEAFLTAEGGSVKRAAASALETVARSTALIMRKFATQDLSVDGPAVAKELRESAASLRAQATAEELAADETAYGLDVVPLWRFPAAPCWGDQLL